ncbi:hypothetical protein Pd630_LPD07134 [Rhodococcus opacus PD630]|nr:hypothetical protein Pd630_LPD07134 [Rhodococcus opacus PD630]
MPFSSADQSNWSLRGGKNQSRDDGKSVHPGPSTNAPTTPLNRSVVSVR